MKHFYLKVFAVFLFVSLSSAGFAVEVVDIGATYSIEHEGRMLAVFSAPTLAMDATAGQLEKAGPYWKSIRLTMQELLKPEVEIADAGQGWTRVGMKWNLAQPTRQDELSIAFLLTFEPDFHWMPHLSPAPGFVVGQHVFRAPAIIVAEGAQHLALVPDIELVGQREDNPWFLDMDAPAGRLWMGMSRTEISFHVGFKKVPGMTFEPGPVELAFYVHTWEDKADPPNPWRPVADFFWSRYGSPLLSEGEPLTTPLDRYVEHTYHWAFNSWEKFVWQEFKLDGRTVGAPQFIVNYSQSPNYEGEWFQREFLSIWNQAWFSSLRSASGVARYARRTNNEDLARRAELTKQLALAAPNDKGVFPAVIAVGNQVVEIEGEEYRRPKGWDEAYWTNSNRCPRNHGITPEYYHVLDASWTALLMLRWYEEIEADPELLAYARKYAHWLLSTQDEEGFFPGWLHPETLEPGPVMNRTPESSMSVTFLLKLAELTDEKKYQEAALKALDAVLAGPAAEGNWLDYETYWSCSAFARDTHLNKKFKRNDMHKQNTLSLFWTAEALLAAYRLTNHHEYLDWGVRTLDELSMAQQVWQPPFIYVPALGGFGVMNFDGEWNDSRQTLFAELFLDYYKETGNPNYFERGVAALKSGFIMMYCPENPQQMVQYEKRYEFFGPEDYGFTMENYGHGGRTSPEGMGIGPFTIYDWGNGAASEARNRVRDHWGDVYIDLARGQGFGIDSVAVKREGNGWRLTDMTPEDEPREIEIVFSDGQRETVELKTELLVK